MIERPGTWGEVTAGTTLLSPTKLPLLIARTAPDKKGKLWYLAKDHNSREFRISPKLSDEPVTILECTEDEAEDVARELLGATHLLHLEREARMADRSKQWIVPPLPMKGRGALDRARDHLSWYHGTYSGPADAYGGFKTLKQIAAAHEEMHDETAVGGLFMDMPHSHEAK